jgi:hypothetical protein
MTGNTERSTKIFFTVFTKHKKFQNTEKSASIGDRKRRRSEKRAEQGEGNEHEFYKILFEQGMGPPYGYLSL